MTSSAAQESQSTDYLYDFVYLDRPRVASYLAQVIDEGVIVSSKTGSSSSDGVDSQTKVGLAGNGVANTDKTSVSKSIERHYDATWSAFVGAFDKLDELGYISSDILSANLSHLVLVTGGLEIIDIRMLKEMWPLFSDEVVKGASPSKKNLAEARREVTKMIGLLSKLPHALQMSITGDDFGEAWSTLDPAGLTINSDDFAFKHGASIAGTWHVIGVLDAKPDSGAERAPLVGQSDLKNGMLGIMTMMRTFFGRPSTAFGITPLAIFRPIRKRA